MKNYFFLFLFIFFSNLKVVCQKVVDSAEYKCTYKLVYLTDSTRPDKTSNDVLTLLIGKNYSFFFSYLTFRADSAFKNDIDGGKITPEQLVGNKNIQMNYTHAGPYSLYKLHFDNIKNKIITTDKIVTNRYIYEETSETIKWTISPDTATTMHYLVQKAVGSFRGRTYIAWFAPGIPLNIGPYKFSGLPGLILRIADTKNNYSFECIGFERLLTKQEMIINDINCIKTTRSEFRKLFKMMFENPWETMISNSSATIGGRDLDKIKTMMQKGIPYNPIELE